jgi:hypothetical protein
MTIPFHQTVVPLLLAPIGAMIVVGPLALIGPDASAVLIYLLITALVCYGIEILFVVPVLLLWPRMRQPPLWVGALWGVSVGWCVLALVYVASPPRSPEAFWLRLFPLLGFSLPGLLSGVVYSLASRRQSSASSL